MMQSLLQIDAHFIEENTHFPSLIQALKSHFTQSGISIPKRHHHDFQNASSDKDTTLLLMPAWDPSGSAGVKVVTVNPDNDKVGLPSVQGVYIHMEASTGVVKAIIDAKSLTAKRTAAASALASTFLSNKNADSLLMIGTGALASNLIQAHASVRNIKQVYLWGRNYKKAEALSEKLKPLGIQAEPIQTIEEKISEVSIISCATLSATPLVLGKYLRPGQHIDLVGAYKPNMREADDVTIEKASVHVDTYQGLNESGDIVIPMQNGILKREAIQSDLFELCSNAKEGRTHDDEITLFKSVGHAIEDLAAANYYYKKMTHA
ncbi:ornithine cyclodeaminase family protein [Aureisphaera galaxeae]|uniref:ornithine cyclodeaminase family protein n=1 Tax=Aureisphaera galaxeae TaxID=1538023 RepID=UPI002350E818|nr:ornithine cyclodeaminase family protein [Aureisphaera galaxeae]MDC8002895.1 ornithine cyclodeaminase family protein [Aureisphaera galaxeae]